MQKQQKCTKMAKTKLSITRSIFKLEAPDFAWYSIYTKRKNVKTQNCQQRGKNGKTQKRKKCGKTAKNGKTQKRKNV